jgi:hypothetical protein
VAADARSGDDNVHVQNTEAMVNALVAAIGRFPDDHPNRNHAITGNDAAASVYAADQVRRGESARTAAPAGAALP